MKRTTVVALAALTVAGGLAAHPANAAVGKKKTTTTTYSVTLNPDPTLEAQGQVTDGCTTVVPGSSDLHKYTAPGKGYLEITLEAGAGTPVDPTDWDMWLLDAGGEIVNSSHGDTASEFIEQPVAKKSTFGISVCNLAGQPNGKVTIKFTSK